MIETTAISRLKVLLSAMFLLVVFSIFSQTKNCGSPCTNPGFELDSAFWNFWAGNPSINADPNNLTPGFNPTPPGSQPKPNPFLITNAADFDQIVGGTILPVVPPGGDNKALRIGDKKYWGGSSWGAARASISFTVSASNSNFIYKYAVVLHDPVTGHDSAERPYFRVRVHDAGGNIITCGNYNVVADPTKPEFASFIETAPNSDIWYRPWATAFIPLQGYIGQCITVEFTTSDCTIGNHLGYAYIDCVCESLSIISSSPNICGGHSVLLTAPAGGESYAWTNSLGGTTGIVGSATNQTATVNIAGTYNVVITSVAGPACAITLNITVGTSPTFPISQFTNLTQIPH